MVKIYPLVISADKNTYESNECSICLEKIINKLTLPCGHQFHSDCILDWFEKELSCPICRIKLRFIKSLK
jgi:hypothetical protein